MRSQIVSMVAAVGCVLSITTVPAFAHHSFAAEFDREKPVTLEGTVKEFRWVNPHSWLHVNVMKPDGSVEEWAVEGGAPSALLRRGWDRNTLPAGTRVTVNGFMAKDGSPRANATDITFPDGKKMSMASSSENEAPKESAEGPKPNE
jgi:Family of unknown function (DUF6152)